MSSTEGRPMKDSDYTGPDDDIASGNLSDEDFARPKESSPRPVGEEEPDEDGS
jgi:hypothetical protein